MFQPDRIDTKILDRLQRQGRISMTELGEQVGLSTSACAERVKRLEHNGIISGYHAHLDAARLGRGLLVFIEITLSQKAPQIFEAVKSDVGQMPEVLECHLVSGHFDYLIKARLRAMSDYRELLGKILKKIPVAAQSNSYVVMEEIKDSTVIALDR
ncbi:MAG: winged helix-turn-helix transcriptional regulator [Rhodoferax sp.]